MKIAEQGKWPLLIYKAVTWAASPFLGLHMRMRSSRGLEHSFRWPERFGRPSVPRPKGPLLWVPRRFSWYKEYCETMSALPIIERCIQARPCFSILMTTSTMSAFSVLENRLPECVICQFAPVDTPTAVDAFLRHWYPDVAVFIESELWPNLLLSASNRGMLLALVNARISAESFRRWSVAPARAVIASVLSRFALIIPQNTREALHFQLLGASPFQIRFAGNLKYVSGKVKNNIKESVLIEEFTEVLSREIWMASSTHEGEEDVMIWIHKELAKMFPQLLTIIVPRHPERACKLSSSLQQEGMVVAHRSRNDCIHPNTKFYIVDTIGELNELYKITPIAVIGGSFIPGSEGHNIAEAAAAGCAVLTGPYVGHFSQMVKEMQNLFPNSVQQVHDKFELLKKLCRLLNDKQELEMHRQAAKAAALTAAEGVLEKVWHLLDTMVLKKALLKY